MNDDFPRVPLSMATGRAIAIMAAIRKRGQHASNIWIFDSPKNNQRFIIVGDMAFIGVVCFEGDPDVDHYTLEPEPVHAVIDGETYQTQLDAHVTHVDGHVEWVEFKREPDTGPQRSGRAKPQLSAQAQAAATAGVKYRVVSERDFRDRLVFFDNWCVLCAAITRARGQPSFVEAKRLQERMAGATSEARVGDLVSEPDCDPAVMLAVIATCLQKGVFETDLHTRFFTHDSILRRRAA